MTATAVSPAQINLSWTASTDDVGVTGYKVYRGGLLRATLGNVTTYQDSGLTPLTLYSYTVSALDGAANESGQSASASATTLADVTPPSVPTGLTATPISSSRIDLSWTASTDNVAVTGYKVYRAGVLRATLGNVTTYQDTGLTPLTLYSYTVSAFDGAANESGQSAPASATTLFADVTPPSVPTGVTATALSVPQINLSWIPSTDNVAVTGYKVYRGGALRATLGNVTTYQDTGLAASTLYSYTVSALDAATNESAQSAPPASATTLAPGTPVILEWNAVTDPNLSFYRVYFGTASRTYQQTLGAGLNVGNVTTYTVNGLSSGTTYFYTVTAVDTSNNESAYSNEISAVFP